MNQLNFSTDEILEWTFPGISILVRDCDISPQLLSLYYIGQIIRSDIFVESSHTLCKQLKNTRFLILSSKSADLYQFQNGKIKYPLDSININSYFKVLDICNINNKNQIILLHIPFNGISLFRNNLNTFRYVGFGDNIENYLIQKSREKIRSSEEIKVIPELEDEEWIQMTNWPIGINSEGNLNQLTPEIFKTGGNFPETFKNEKEFQLSELIKKITADNFINQDLSNFSFLLESKTQEISVDGKEYEFNYDNYSVFFSLLEDKKFVFNAAKLISPEGKRVVTIVENDLEIADIKPDRLTLKRQLSITNNVEFTLDIYLKSGMVFLIVLNKLDVKNNSKNQTVFRI
jgi:hypothetical protein